MRISVQWSGIERMLVRLDEYERRVMQAVRAVADYFAPIIESAAKENAPWEDRTGAARQGLRSFVEELSQEVVAIYLTHSMEYGIFLETMKQGSMAAVLPTLEEHAPEVMKMLQEIFQ